MWCGLLSSWGYSPWASARTTKQSSWQLKHVSLNEVDEECGMP